jgi:hypothetical protein
MENITPEEALALIEGYRKVPEQYVHDVYGDKPWEVQVEILRSVFANRKTTVASCNAIGKSFLAARVAHAFLDLIPGSLVVTTAPTWRQVKDVLWREFAIAHTKARFPLGGKLSQTGFEYDKDWFAVGLSTKYPENFFGYHADYILVIVDEAGGIEEEIFRGVKAITPNVNARILYIGNPTNPGGTFQQSHEDPTFKKFQISAFDTPNFKHVGINTLDDLLAVMTPPDGVDPLDHKPFADVVWPYPTLISPEVVYDRYHEWGTDSPAWESLVMGQFPSQSDQALFPADLVNMAMGMDKVDPDTNKTYAELSGWNIPDGPMTYGQDMARYGLDKCVCFPRRGGWVQKAIAWGKIDLMASADRILNIIDPLDETVEVNIDDTGNGGGTTDRLRQISDQLKLSGEPSHRYRLNAYNMSSKEKMTERELAKFHDVTSMMYWNLRTELLNKRIALPDDEELKTQLIARRWKLDGAGKIQVESKDDYRNRTGGKSPDKADALALAFARKRPTNTFITQPKKPEEKRPAHAIARRATTPRDRQGSILTGLGDRF